VHLDLSKGEISFSTVADGGFSFTREQLTDCNDSGAMRNTDIAEEAFKIHGPVVPCVHMCFNSRAAIRIDEYTSSANGRKATLEPSSTQAVMPTDDHEPSDPSDASDNE